MYRSINVWNKLKPEYTLIEDPTKFKIAIKKDYPKCFMNVN